MLDFSQFQAISFDCYGTLIDWESGLLAALRPVLTSHGSQQSDEELLERFARLEAEEEQGRFRVYPDVLRSVMQRLAAELGFEPSDAEADVLWQSIEHWPLFPDTVPALHRLKGRYRLAIISNITDALLARSVERMQISFDWLITAEQAGCYKPAERMFETALDTMGLSPERLLHVAQSKYHDIAPANALALATVWVNRRSDKPGQGATAPSVAMPDLEVPDLEDLLQEAGKQ